MIAVSYRFSSLNLLADSPQEPENGIVYVIALIVQYVLKVFSKKTALPTLMNQS
jgi:hypothetical protein